MKIISKNKRAYFDYEFQKTFDAGIVLKWFEVKWIKTWNVNIKDAIARFYWDEIFLTNMDIPLYKKVNPKIIWNYNVKWKRKLLLKKDEIKKIYFLIENKSWNTIVPLEVFISKRWRIKIKLWIWKLKRKIEKKQILKERDIKRQMQKDIKNIWY